MKVKPFGDICIYLIAGPRPLLVNEWMCTHRNWTMESTKGRWKGITANDYHRLWRWFIWV